MNCEFRSLHAGISSSPAAGEVHVVAGPGARMGLASSVLEHGTAAVRVGPGSPMRIVVDSDPALDEMLAATFLSELLDGRTLPPGAAAFARYAELIREGLRPGQVPVAASLEGIFLAIRNIHGSDLGNPVIATKFLGDWSRMAARILEAARAGIDPFTTALFDTGVEFSRERAFLLRDHHVYEQDLRRGEQWRVSFAGAPPGSHALVLREPKSLLFKYWSRAEVVEAGAPQAQAFLLLAVCRGDGRWVVTTDPVQRVPLTGLCHALQAAETAKGDARGRDWSEPERFGQTLVAAPRNGTLLTEPEVLAIVRRWSTSGSKTPSRRKMLVGALAVGVLILGGATASSLLRDRGRLDQSLAAHTKVRPTDDGSRPARNLSLLAVGVSSYSAPGRTLMFADQDARALAETMSREHGGVFAKVEQRVLINQDATKDAILKHLNWLRQNTTQHDLAMLTLAGHGAKGLNGRFFFLPHDYAPDQELSSSAISWDDFREYLEGIACPVFVVMDTCYSGEITKLGARGAQRIDGLADDIGSELRQFASLERGIIVMASSLSKQEAVEDPRWGHGALTLALLEGIKREWLFRDSCATTLPPLDRELTMKALDFYVTNRVKELVGGDQSVVTNQSGDLALDQILIASIKRP